MAIPTHVLTIESMSGENDDTSSEAPAPNPHSGPPLIHHPQGNAGRLGRKLQAGNTKRSSSSNELGAPLARKDQSDKGSLLPRFGEWNVKDPASGVGFTAVFEKVVHEKKTGRAAFFSSNHAASLLPMKFRGSSQSSAEGSSLQSWCCCCLRRKG
ncbi:hypothetical protein GOP47_0027279 [Adiantum capillus-veneris]|nr:hypothetical protein GOP47_0027279 [Adiantum capillus-veneris]